MPDIVVAVVDFKGLGACSGLWTRSSLGLRSGLGLHLGRPATAGHAVPASGMRASDADREAIVDVLGEAVAQGRLSFTEFEERVARAYEAKTFGQLQALTSDLPAASVGSALPAIHAGPMLALLSNEGRTGKWLVPPRLRVRAVLGSVDLDFCEAVLSSREVVIDVHVLLGSVTLVVPDGVHVRVHGTAVMGSRGSRLRKPPGPDVPTIDVRGVVVLGHLDVRSPSKKRRRQLADPNR